MIFLLLLIIVLLIGILIFQWKIKKEQERAIQYIHRKLHVIVNEQTYEKILVTTTNSEIQQLLITLNTLLDQHQKFRLHIVKWKIP